MQDFTLYDLSMLANAVEHQRKLANDEYAARMNSLDRLSGKIRARIDVLETSKTEELRERGFYEEE